MTIAFKIFRPIHRGEPLVQLHATDHDIFENGELRFELAEEKEDTVANLFAVHPKSGLIVSKYSLQLKDLDFLAPSKSVMKQTFIVKIKVNMTALRSQDCEKSVLVEIFSIHEFKSYRLSDGRMMQHITYRQLSQSIY